MKVQGTHYKTIWMEGDVVFMIEQNKLPFSFQIHKCYNYRETCKAIVEMTVRGAGAIGAAAGYAMAQAFMADENVLDAREYIKATRPTARDLFYAVNEVYEAGIINKQSAIIRAKQVAFENEEAGRLIGSLGNTLIPYKSNILTHCNAGWLAFVDHGSALAPIYAAHKEGKQIHVYVDETRPRSQGARLTAWELSNEGIPHTIIPDNAGAYLMSKGLIDLVITGADRITANGDAANKIGTLEKAIVANYYGVPFYIAAPTSTIDFFTETGKEIIIEERSQDEVLWQTGTDASGTINTVRVANPASGALNPAFDVTPNHLIDAFITEKGIIKATELSSLLLHDKQTPSV